MSGRDDILARLSTALPQRPADPRCSVVVARLVALSAAGAWVRIEKSGPPTRARCAIELADDDVDRDFVVAFDGGDAQRPLVIGRILDDAAVRRDVLHARTDGERLFFSARERIVIECGSASITLTSAGKVLIRGQYVQSRATGVNSVKGGSVELN